MPIVPTKQGPTPPSSSSAEPLGDAEEAKRLWVGAPDRLRLLPPLIGRNQSQISKDAGLNRSHTGAFFNRAGNLGGEQLAKIAWTTGVSLNFLMLNHGPMFLVETKRSERHEAAAFAAGQLDPRAISGVLELPENPDVTRFEWLELMKARHAELVRLSPAPKKRADEPPLPAGVNTQATFGSGTERLGEHDRSATKPGPKKKP